ncbi:hypothetical protein C2G38_2122524 [Gigaspora rosea]|uniref:Uncharacterized protein n=1 Tax=Gigaspora rosea TaxID=44941 RepID=A0A397U3G1_9GLOM|nr:hypothetical protein C2G38_2130703 [Gigaspora rosea]RIB03678.1 hypothetical protein C2G38_2122524 [Gigaspora rosea]
MFISCLRVLLADNFNIYILMILWFFCAFGTSIVFNSLSTYLIDVCPGFDASAIALSNCIRLIIRHFLFVGFCIYQLLSGI